MAGNTAALVCGDGGGGGGTRGDAARLGVPVKTEAEFFEWLDEMMEVGYAVDRVSWGAGGRGGGSSWVFDVGQLHRLLQPTQILSSRCS